MTDQPIIVGGAIAGSAVAIDLARGGAKPLIVEKHLQTGDTICGGFLSWQSVAALERLGLPPSVLGGQTITKLRLFAGSAQAQANLPQPGIGLSRHRLDTLLNQRAEACGVAIERGVIIRSIADGAAIAANGARFASTSIFLANGKSALPGHARIPPPAVARDPVIGLRLRLPASAHLARLLADYVELFLFDRGYAGLVRQEDGSANFCLAVHKSRLAEAAGRPVELLTEWADAQPQLADRLRDWDPHGLDSPNFDAIAAVPYGWMTGKLHALPQDGFWRLGDQAAVIPSLAGEGMGIALATAASAAKAWQSGQTADAWQHGMARQLSRPMAIARVAWHVAESGRWNMLAVRALAHTPALVRMIGNFTRINA